MSDVTFNEPDYGTPGANRGTPVGAPKPSAFSSMVINLGLAKDGAGAQRVLAISAVVIAVIAIGVYVWSH
jgi:hypothetical protein